MSATEVETALSVARRRLSEAVMEVEDCAVNDMPATMSLALDRVDLWSRVVMALEQR